MIELEITEGIATVKLNRPNKLNALNFQCFKELDSILKQLRKNRQLRAVILKAEGPDFCSGLDVKAVMGQPKQMLGLLYKWNPFSANLVQRVVLGWQRIQVPVFALVQGRCYGAGCQLIGGADYVVATPDAEFSVMESRWGLCPDMAALHFLSQKIRYDELLWLAQSAETIDANRAQEIGLITAVSDLSDEWIEDRFSKLMERSPDSLAASKRLTQNAYKQQLGKLLARETYSQIRLLFSKNTRTAIHNQRHEEKKTYQPPKRW